LKASFFCVWAFLASAAVNRIRSIAMPLGATADRPSAWWRAGSSMTMFDIGALCRGFLVTFSNLEVNGLEAFTELLDSRRDPSKRTRGLITGKYLHPCSLHPLRSIGQSNSYGITVSNHISVYVCTVQRLCRILRHCDFRAIWLIFWHLSEWMIRSCGELCL
jgi:hypothetical protein